MMRKGVVPSRCSLLGENTMPGQPGPRELGSQPGPTTFQLGDLRLSVLAASFPPSVNMLHMLIQRVTYVKTLHKKGNSMCTQDILITVLKNKDADMTMWVSV